jgi:NADH:ubiquinone oxidoreductase subunit
MFRGWIHKVMLQVRRQKVVGEHMGRTFVEQEGGAFRQFFSIFYLQQTPASYFFRVPTSNSLAYAHTAGVALSGRTRRMILERDSDSLDQYGSYETSDLHPLWHAWLSHRLPSPPTAEVCLVFSRKQYFDLLLKSYSGKARFLNFNRRSTRTADNRSSFRNEFKSWNHSIASSRSSV